MRHCSKLLKVLKFKTGKGGKKSTYEYRTETKESDMNMMRMTDEG